MLADPGGATLPRREQLLQCYDRLETSLLRYLRDANPWVDDRHAGAIQELRSQANDQDQSLATVADLLFERNWIPSSPTWPEEYATMQYLSLRFLWDRLQEDQQEIVALLDAAVAWGTDETESATIAEVRSREAQRLDALRQVSLTP